MSLHILIITHWYYPEPVTKPHDLATELIKRDIRVTVITGFPNYPSGKVYDGYKNRSIVREEIDGVKVIRIPHFIDRTRSGIRRVFSYISFALLAAGVAIFLRERMTAVWTYQIGLPGLVYSLIRNVPLVHEVLDLWPDWSRTTDMGMKELLFNLLNSQEKLVYKRSRQLITISNGLQRSLIDKGVNANKIHIIPNWANEDLYKPTKRNAVIGQNVELTGRFNIIYGGNIGIAQALDTVLDAACLLEDLQDIQFVIIGDGVERERLTSRISREEINNVRLIGSRPPESMSELYAWSECLLIHLMKDPMYEIAIPSKTYAYLACGRPIIVAAFGDVAEFVNELGAGITCPPQDSRALARIIREFFKMPVDSREAMGLAGRKAFENKFSRKVLVDQYETLFTEIS